MPPAAKITISHACPLHGTSAQVSGSSDTFIGFMPAGRVADVMACGAPVTTGSATVIINHRMAARLGDPTGHGGTLVSGHPTVLIGVPAQGATLAAAAADGTPFCEECEKAKRAREEAEALRNGDPAEVPTDDTVVDTAPDDDDRAQDEAPEELAAAEGPPGDPLADVRAEARQSVARDFLHQNCTTRPASWIEGAVRCIDPSRPVRVLPLVGEKLPSLAFVAHAALPTRALQSAIQSAVAESASLPKSLLRPAERILSKADFTRALESAITSAEKPSGSVPEKVRELFRARLPLLRETAAPIAPDTEAAVSDLRAATFSHVSEASPTLARTVLELLHAHRRFEALPHGA